MTVFPRGCRRFATYLSNLPSACCMHAQLTMAATSKTSWDKLKCYAVTMARTPEGASARPCSSSSRQYRQPAVRLIPPCPSSHSSSPIQFIVILSPRHYLARTIDEALKPNIEDKEESSPCRPHRGAPSILPSPAIHHLPNPSSRGHWSAKS